MVESWGGSLYYFVWASFPADPDFTPFLFYYFLVFTDIPNTGLVVMKWG